jgi:hypothetical protein
MDHIGIDVPKGKARSGFSPILIEASTDSERVARCLLLRAVGPAGNPGHPFPSGPFIGRSSLGFARRVP